MTGEERDLIAHRLARAEETLGEGRALLAAGSLPGAVNRLYYAAFYAARAVLATRGLDSSKHSGVIALFNQHFVKTGAIPAGLRAVLTRAFERRQDSDYGDFVNYARPEVEALAGEVEAFLRACRQIALPAAGQD